MQGSLPDMTATTALYLDLQRIYREQADRDIAAVTAHAHAILSSVNRTPRSISASNIKTFCKHARYLRYDATPHSLYTPTTFKQLKALYSCLRGPNLAAKDRKCVQCMSHIVVECLQD